MYVDMHENHNTLCLINRILDAFNQKADKIGDNRCKNDTLTISEN